MCIGHNLGAPAMVILQWKSEIDLILTDLPSSVFHAE